MTNAVPPTPPPSPTPPPATPGGFDMNRPTIISLLYLSSFILGVTALIGVILAFVWKGEPHEDWEETHYQYLINTFWIGLVGTIVGIVTMIVLVGFLVLLATVALCVVRSVLSLLKAQKREPMPNPGTLFA
ncbi:MAG TPA: hypothetical protein PLL44_05820 [Novosphingobium sp.]|jgi:uncharacterized membrane protein|nr:hypothetical protein [Novosphingobium sp.]HQN53931.1 hypothetical protein [Novosphingobium sp.]HQQ08390.1 hypothetical protein [Novosphingobium sp.]